MQTSEFRFLPNTSSHRVPSQTLLHLLKWMMKTQIPQALILSHLLIIQELLLFLSLCLVLRIIQVVLGLCFSHWVKETSLDLWMVKSLCQILPLLCSMPGIDPIQQFFLGWPIRWARKLQLVWYIYINTARDLWIDMRDRFAQGNVPRPFELPKEIARFSQSQLFVSSYSQNSRFFGMNLWIINLFLLVLVVALVVLNNSVWCSTKRPCFPFSYRTKW